MKCIQTLVYCIVWVSPPNYGKAEKVTTISDPAIQSTITENGVKILSSDLLGDLHRTIFQKFDENQPLIRKRIDELIKPNHQLEFSVTTAEAPFDNLAYPYHYKRSYHYSYPLIFYDSYLDSQIRKSPEIYQSEYTFGPKTIVFTKKPCYVQEVAAVKANPKTNITNSTFANYQNQSWKSPNLGVLLGTHNSNHPSIRESYENLNYYQSFSLPYTTSASLSYSEGVTTTNSLNENFSINKDEIPRNYSGLFPTYFGDFHLPGYDSTPLNNIPVQAIEGLFSGNFEKEYSVKKPYLGLYTIPGPIYPTQLGVQDSLNPLTPSPSTSSQNLESSASVKSADVNITKIEEKDLLGRKKAIAADFQ